MTLLAPLALLLLVPIAGMAAFARATGRSAGVRLLLLGLLCLAAAQPVLLRPDAREVTVFVVDTSASIPLAEQQRALDLVRARSSADPGQVGLLAFDTAPRWIALPGQPLPADRIDPPAEPGQGSDLPSALEAALAVIPQGVRGRIVVMTDGRIEGALDEALARAAAQGVALEGVTLDPARPEPGPGPLALARPRAVPGETLAATLVVHGGQDGIPGSEIQVYVEDDPQPVLRQPVALAADERAEVALAIPLPAALEAGAARIRARLGESGGAVAEAGVLIQRPPRVLLVGSPPAEVRSLQAALEAEGMRVALRPPHRPDALEGQDLVVLVNTPSAVGRPDLAAEGLPESFVRSLRGFVEEGGGLVVVGGDRAYDQGGWQDSALAELLPVEIDPEGAQKEQAVTLLLVLDKSGSMAEPADFGEDLGRLLGTVTARMSGGNPVGSKMRLANEGAIAAMNLLRDTDALGVLAVDTQPMWAVPLQPVGDREALAQQIASIRGSGGGIYLLTTLEQAQAVLRSVDTPLRHLILFADASDVGEQRREDRSALDLAAEMRAERITLSVIGIGSDSARDAAFLRQLAERGGGRIHLTADARTLPALFTQETERLLGSGLREEPLLRARQERWHPALQGIDLAEAPPLRGVNHVRRRPRARVLLTADAEGTPLLALWRRGLGEVAALTTDAGARWAGRWLRWPGYPRLWTQLARSLTGTARASRDEDAFSFALLPGRRAVALVTLRRADGLSEDVPGLRLRLAPLGAAQADSLTLSSEQTAPGQWRSAAFPVPPGSAWQVEVQDAQGLPLARQDWLAPPSAEAAWRTPDPDLLARLQQPAPAAAAPPPRTGVALAPWLLALAALLLPLDARLRRPPFR